MKSTEKKSKESLVVRKMFTYNHIKKILSSPSQLFNKLTNKALMIKKSIYGNDIFVRGIVEFSNYCRRDCLYCGIRRSKNIYRYRLSIDEILRCANKIYKRGIKSIILQSGEDLYYSRETLVHIIKNIKKETDCKITLAIGERSVDDYKAFFDAGADRFLIKHETSNEKVYNKLHPGDTLKNRLKQYEILKKIGYKVGLGNIIGLPFTTIDDYIKDIILMKKLDCDMAAIGPFIPAKETPLEDYQPPHLDLVLKILAIARITLKDVNIPATTALHTLGGITAINKAFESGCNVIMLNFTPKKYGKNYQIYSSKKSINLKELENIIIQGGYNLSYTYGERRKLYVH